MASTPTQLMTFAEFERLPDPREGRYELHHGELILMPPPKQRHKRLQVVLQNLLSGAIVGGWVVVSEYGYQPVGELEYRVADLAVVSTQRWNSTDPNGYFQGSPEFVAEVLSPSNRVPEMRDKRDICLRTGAREFWLVDPDHHTVEVSTPDDRTITYRAGSQIPLFCGGVIHLDEIFV